jgi:hypothetical protein
MIIEYIDNRIYFKKIVKIRLMKNFNLKNAVKINNKLNNYYKKLKNIF